MGHQAQDRPQEGQEDHPRNPAVVPAASAHGRYGAASGAVLEASRSLPVFRRALQHESHGSGTRSSVPCLALLAPPSQQQESNALGEVRGIVTAITVAVTQDHPRSLIVCGVTKLCVGIGVAILITEEPDDRIGHVRICGGDGSVMAVSTRRPLLCERNLLKAIRFLAHWRLTPRVKVATTLRARPARRLAALQLVAIERLFRLTAPCQTPRGTHPEGRPTALFRFICVLKRIPPGRLPSTPVIVVSTLRRTARPNPVPRGDCGPPPRVPARSH